MPDVAEVDRADAAAGATPIDALAAELATGKLTAQQVIDKLVDQIAGSDQLSAADRADLRELLTDLIASDPHLSALAGRL